MASESRPFVASFLGFVVGLGIMLFGVSLNAGQGVNAPMAIGGVVILAATGVLAAAVIALDEGAQAH